MLFGGTGWHNRPVSFNQGVDGSIPTRLDTTTVSYSGRSRGVVPRLPLSLWLVLPLRIALSRFGSSKPSTPKSATQDRDRGTTPEVLLFSSEVVLFCSEVLPQPLRLRKYLGEEGLWPRSQIFEKNGTTTGEHSQGTTPGSTIGVVTAPPTSTTSCSRKIVVPQRTTPGNTLRGTLRNYRGITEEPRGTAEEPYQDR
jgi:hypothetical protein